MISFLMLFLTFFCLPFSAGSDSKIRVIKYPKTFLFYFLRSIVLPTGGQVNARDCGLTVALYPILDLS